MNLEKTFSDFASKTARITGQPITFLACVALVVAWAASGPVFGFSETWQLVINTGTTIITFLMVFLIQNTQNRDSEAVQAKLDALVLVSDAENDFVGIEDLTDKELREMHRRCAKAAKAHTELHQKLNEELDSRKDEKPKPARKTASPKRPAKAKT
ncbi:MAG: hypothetical protein JWR84_3602 [Caulobacter sp.]|nr:hypothetical protein [Caulobacter sp.]